MDTKLTNEVYTELFSKLDLSPTHASALNRRGLTAPEVEALGYRTLTAKRSAMVEEIARKFDGKLEGVPGFYRDTNGRWKLAGRSGLAIPIRNEAGEIVGVKIRADRPKNPQAKYTQLSSNPKPDPKTGEVNYPFGTAAVLAVHHPLDRPGKKLDTLRITEGEIKADIATNITGIFTVSLPGVNLWRHALPVVEREKPKRVLIAFDSDKDGRTTPYEDPKGNPVSVAKSLAQLYLAIEKLGFPVEIETWESEAGKGIDDVLVNGGDESVRTMSEEEAREFVEEAVKGDLPLGWIYVMGTKRFIHTETLIEMDREQFDAMHMHEGKGLPSTKALRNPAFPKAHFPIYMPNAAPTFEEDGKTFFNLWRPHAGVEPKEGSVKPFLDHVSYILPDPDEAKVLLDWLAFCVQNPGAKIHWAILLQGTQGTGKSFFGWLMKRMLGSRNVSTPSNEIIHEIFTGWAKACQLIVIEELMARGRLELMNKLKPMITQDTVMIREMHRPPYEQPNVFNMLMFTNHEDAIILDRSDRRYCVLFSPAEPREHDYYRELWAWSEAHAGEILFHLASRDLSGFLAKGHAPMTEAKRSLIRDSMLPLEAWMREGIEDERWPFMSDIVSTGHLVDCVPRNISASPQAIGKLLKAVGAANLGQIPLETGGKMRMWAIRRQETWRSASPKAIAEEYGKWSNSAEPGGNPLLESKPM